jgi:hypothetical protein
VVQILIMKEWLSMLEVVPIAVGRPVARNEAGKVVEPSNPATGSVIMPQKVY